MTDLPRTPSTTNLRELRFFWAYRLPVLTGFMRRWGHTMVLLTGATSVVAMHLAGLGWLDAVWETAAMQIGRAHV